MEIIIEIIVEVFIEIIGQFIAGLIAENIMQSVRASKFIEYFFCAVGYIIFGAIIGYASMLAFPKILLKNPNLQIINLLLVPILVALAICAVGNWRKKISIFRINFEIFIFAYLFAFTVSFVRYSFLDVAKPFW
ncbi:hypothetical protein [Leptospira sarikeiensis]|uniref:Uncharacterized protein n=1 Tax=Leptospira sarikeiensis TaxID=2484943 RepID=A0A4R9K0T3_9LEPT|nr:hypothetical protein [Leptospira sarikeiensis]TGL58721.1 hypothetical protein EHQ64_16855 [Leptospira sarikeiensis]